MNGWDDLVCPLAGMRKRGFVLHPSRLLSRIGMASWILQLMWLCFNLVWEELIVRPLYAVLDLIKLSLLITPNQEMIHQK